jgi:hypothetical protein
MADEQVPESVRDFVLKYIGSIAQLEALLLLWRAPDVAWNAASIAKRLYIREGEATQILAQLHADGLIVVDQATLEVRGFEPQHKELIDRLAASYAKQLIPITNIIHRRPRRIREFADAFKFRKDS